MGPPTTQKTCAAIALLLTCVAVMMTGLDVEKIHELWTGGSLLGGKSVSYQLRYPVGSTFPFFNGWRDNISGQAAFHERALRTQTERRQKLAEGCHRLAETSGDGLRSQYRMMFNVPSPLPLTYCAIPKCSTTTWFNFFERVTGSQCRPGVTEYTCARLKFQQPSTVEEFQSTSLVVVRDPWRRLVSAYEDKFVTQRRGPAENCYRRHGKSIYGGFPVTFAEFVRCILEDYGDGRALDAHYAPQHWQCLLCKANYSIIAKLETLADDFRYLATYVFPEQNYTAYHAVFSSAHRRPVELHNMSSIAYDDCYRSLEPADVKALVRLYRPDAELLGYPLQPMP